MKQRHRFIEARLEVLKSGWARTRDAIDNIKNGTSTFAELDPAVQKRYEAEFSQLLLRAEDELVVAWNEMDAVRERAARHGLTLAPRKANELLKTSEPT